MKAFEEPRIEIERFELVDTITISSVERDPIPSMILPDDEFSHAPGFYASHY